MKCKQQSWDSRRQDVLHLVAFVLQNDFSVIMVIEEQCTDQKRQKEKKWISYFVEHVIKTRHNLFDNACNNHTNIRY
jgi:hypothetical protein